MRGRYGGDEFIILLPDADIECCMAIAQRILLQFTLSIVNYHNHDISATASFGLTSMTITDAVSFEQLLNYVDKALYMAKDAGRNCIKV